MVRIYGPQAAAFDGAASHDILDSERCNSNALNPKSVLNAPSPPPAAREGAT